MDVIRKLVYTLNFRKVKRRLKSFKNENLLIVDFDNTLALTANARIAGTHKDFNTIKPLKGTIQWVEQKQNDKFSVVVLSARDIKTWFKVKAWISKHSSISAKDVLLVPSPKAKREVYKLGLELFKTVEVIDDFSYGHENGEVQFYAEEINYLESQNIRHYNYTFIADLNRA